MFKLTSNLRGIFKEETNYLNLVAGGLLCIPLAYLAYISMSAYSLGISISTLLTSSSVESVNLIANLTAVYSAYVIVKVRDHMNQKAEFFAFLIIFGSQIILMNQLMFAAFLYYIFHFVGFKNLKSHIQSLETSNSKMPILLSLFVLFIAIVTFLLKLRVGMI